MSFQSGILENNPQLTKLDDVYQNVRVTRDNYKLSSAVLSASVDLFQQTYDRSLFSLDFETRIDKDAITPEIEATRFNYLQIIDYEGINHVLEFSEDFGGVAHYLSDQVNSVDSIKIDSNRSCMSVVRCANKSNITHISEDCDKLQVPQNTYDLIIIGAYEDLGIKHEFRQQFLTQLQAALTAKGVLIINAKNRNSIAKWLNPFGRNISAAIPFEELYETGLEADFERKELLDTLAWANFSSIEFNATFSNLNSFQNIFSEDYLTSNLNAPNHFYRLGMVQNREINEYLLFKNLFDTGKRVFDFASRFLVVAGSSREYTRKVINTDFAHFAGTGRISKWRTTTKRRSGSSTIEKLRTFQHKESSEKQINVDDHLSSDDGLVTQNLAEKPFIVGPLLVDLWLDAAKNNQNDDLSELVQEYYCWLKSLQEQDDFKQFAYDLLPFNIIVKENKGVRTYHMIDTEWQINTDFGADFLVFRALFYFAFENKAALRGHANTTHLASIAVFVLRHMPGATLVGDLQKHVTLEERIQIQISNNFHSKSVEHALLQSFEREPLVQNLDPKIQILWGDASGYINDKSRNTSPFPVEPNQATPVTIPIPKFDDKMSILRIEPVINRGIFVFNSIQIVDEDDTLVWELNSSKEIHAHATIVNARSIENSNRYIALDNGPIISFNLAGIKNIATAHSLKLELYLSNSSNNDEELASLTRSIHEQSIALIYQTSALEEHRFDKATLQMFLKTEIEDRKSQMRNLNRKLTNLNHQLVAQLSRNEKLENFLMTRPSTRIKALIARSLSRLTAGHIGYDSTPKTVEVVETPVDPFGLPDSPDLIGQNRDDYQLWISHNDLNDQQIAQAKEDILNFKLQPLISIVVPVYNTDPEYLIPMIRSVQAQIYSNWQLCMVDDASPKSYLKPILEHEASQDERISIQINELNQGISLTTNDAIALAKGDYIGLLDHDDELSVDALFENIKAINEFPDVGLLYSDEDKMDLESQRLEPFFKPDYSPDLLETNNYICHFTVIKKAIINEIGGFREGLDGSQDHDIIMRSIDKSERVIHIPKILYHWRKIPGSTAVVYDSKSYAWEAGRKATENLLQKKETHVSVEFGSLKGTYRVFREIQGAPLVSIVIPFKDKPKLLDACLASILNRSTYDNFEIIGVNNNSEEDSTFARMQHFRELDSRVHFVEKNVPFNFSEICNYGVEQSKGEYIVLLNNDIEIISPDWIQRLLEHAQRPDIGAVGGKLLYPDGRIQHAGVVVGMVGAAGHPHKYFPDNHIGYHGRLHMVCNVSAVTGAMLMVSKQKYQKVGGLDQTHLAVAYNDVDFCLKLLQHGYVNLFTPHCKATHYESISRGYEDNEEKLQRFEREQKYFLDTWKDFIQAGDPYYNPNLSLDNEYFSLNFH